MSFDQFLCPSDFMLQERQTAREGSSAPCSFRISSEGLPLILPYITKQILHASPADFKHLLQNKEVKFEDFTDAKFGEKAANLLPGCCVVILSVGMCHHAIEKFNSHWHRHICLYGLFSAGNTTSVESLQVDESTIAIGCWKGRARLSVMVTAMDCQELLERLLIRFDNVNGSSGHDDKSSNTEEEIRPVQE